MHQITETTDLWQHSPDGSAQADWLESAHRSTLASSATNEGLDINRINQRSKEFELALQTPLTTDRNELNITADTSLESSIPLAAAVGDGSAQLTGVETSWFGNSWAGDQCFANSTK